ncbi:MAG: diguanylate cyclase [Burkholderiales bacterium]
MELAARKLEPTPDNYRRLYVEINDGQDDTSGIGAEAALQNIAAQVPRNAPDLVRLGNSLHAATESRDWLNVQRVLIEIIQKSISDTLPTAEWASLIRKLVRNANNGISDTHRLPAQKWTALEIALNAGDDLRKLKRRLDVLAAEWETPQCATATTGGSPGQIASVQTAQNSTDAIDSPHSSDATSQLYELLAQALETGISARLFDAPALATEAGEIAKRLRESDAVELEDLHVRLKSLWIKIEVQGNRQDQLQSALLDLLHLMIDNVGELVADDQWLRGQMNVVLQAISRPLSIDALDQAKQNLKDVIFKQSQLKQGLSEVRTTLKKMVVSFIDELGNLSATTGDYHDSVENLSQKIRQTDDVNQLNLLLEEVLRETRDVQASTLRSRQEVLAARQKVDEAERKVAELETALQNVSEKVHTDYLTGTLNRRGLKEAFDRELAISEREKTPTSVALLDIDNFKELNDNFGHQVGDDVLAHLATLIKETVRPGDSVARYGGEEFLILLPNADIEQATAVLTRLQRALTKHFFLHDNCKVLITFSTGVTRHLPGESQESVIARADGALYQAKRSGKNRVVAVQADGIAWQPVMASIAMASGARIPA